MPLPPGAPSGAMACKPTQNPKVYYLADGGMYYKEYKGQNFTTLKCNYCRRKGPTWNCPASVRLYVLSEDSIYAVYSPKPGQNRHASPLCFTYHNAPVPEYLSHLVSKSLDVSKEVITLVEKLAMQVGDQRKTREQIWTEAQELLKNRREENPDIQVVNSISQDRVFDRIKNVRYEFTKSHNSIESVQKEHGFEEGGTGFLRYSATFVDDGSSVKVKNKTQRMLVFTQPGLLKLLKHKRVSSGLLLMFLAFLLSFY